MKAAIAHHERPSVLILGKDSKGGWNKWDTLFAEAYQQFLNELCPQCGKPEYICHTDDSRIEIRPKKDVCEITRVAERKQNAMAEENKKNPSALYGVSAYGVPTLTQEALDEGLEFVDFRRPYYKEQARKRGLIPEENLSE